jgi:hypothetical protein
MGSVMIEVDAGIAAQRQGSAAGGRVARIDRGVLDAINGAVHGRRPVIAAAGEEN